MTVKPYNSRRRSIIVEVIESLDRPFTALQLWEHVSAIEPEVSRATVYRTLQRLRHEGFLKDIILPHGLHVSIRTSANSYCIAECDLCGRFSFRPDITAQLTTPGHVAIHIRTTCPDCTPAQSATKTFRTPSTIAPRATR